MKTYDVTLQTTRLRRSREQIILRQIEEIVGRGLASGRKKSWSCEQPRVIEPKEIEEGWLYEANLVFTYTGKETDAARMMAQIIAIKDFMAKAGNAKGWEVADHEASTPCVNAFNGSDLIADISVNPDGHFDKLYGLDPQIQVLLSALSTAVETDYTKRFHAVLHGQPGCGKSELLSCVKEMVGDEGVMEFDGTQTTAAGAVSHLVDADVLPPVLIIEEIEKVPDQAFMWLLGALDGRAEIRKITAHGVRQRKVPFVCFATVNDLETFESRHKGAMASRFSHKIHCPRPSEEVVRMILEREIHSIAGNPDWIEPAVRHCIDVEKTSDPRRIIAVCLTGKDGLLDGSFQQALRSCSG